MMTSVVHSTNETEATTDTRGLRAATTTAAQTAPSRSDTIIKLLSRTKGATATELAAVTGWQPHSIRAFLSGLRKAGRLIVREARKSGELGYRIDNAAVAKPAEITVALPAADQVDV
jgi:Tfp pilus assembly protein PilX